MPRLARCALSLFVATSSPSLSPFARRSARPFAFAFAAPSRTTCRAATTMAPEAETSTSTTLPRWDLSRFGFDSPFSDGVDSHLSETRKLAETFKGKYEGKLVSKLSPCGLSPIHSAFLIPHDGTLFLVLLFLSQHRPNSPSCRPSRSTSKLLSAAPWFHPTFIFRMTFSWTMMNSRSARAR
jgi:hypothetical protein